jgi:hypothetical protein
VLFIFLDFVLSYYICLYVHSSCCDVRYDFRMETMFGSFYLQLLVEGLMSYLRYLCLFSYSGVQHILCCFCFVYLGLVYPMLPVSLDCPYLIAPSAVFSNVNKVLTDKTSELLFYLLAF